MDTLIGIESIPVPAKDYNTGNDLKDAIWYVLQRKATEHKRNGNLDLAIACLRKSNELSDYENEPLLSEKEYLRLPKYIALSGKKELAKLEKDKIYVRHPEFRDHRLINLRYISKQITNSIKYKNDLVKVATYGDCPKCKRLKGKIYSLSGKSKKFPLIPPEIFIDGGHNENCNISIYSYYPGLENDDEGDPRDNSVR
ncbi:hypothetical protein HMPREF9013_1325 [Bulleidia extructa W1219]|uniref:Uncharacterized protein n=1 Tax=Bulleidia extructa W1219 TaxID=679192 RepID=D2MPK9_9FIRM|nr:hypothetical protein [Bulleidia extructa]EFC05621.1 hypothetical protein HMPREF9013_1325 [Bulleidia extructa W1219]